MRKLIISISFLPFIFFLLVAFNVTPFIRGPGEYPPDWRWQYQFTNTLSRIWLPVSVISAVLAFIWFLEAKSENYLKAKKWLIIVGLIILSYLFQISILYFSRAGITVLIHRIINPDLNGYFSTAIQITNIDDFIRNFNHNVLSFFMHATGHPPGTTLFFWSINEVARLLPLLNNFVIKFSPSHFDVKSIWLSLPTYGKTGALISAFLILLLGTLTMIPLYFLSNFFYGSRIAVRSLFLYLVIPSAIFFVPLPDVFFPLFSVTALAIFFPALKKSDYRLLFLAGLIFSTGLFFTLSILPIIIIFAYFLFKKFRASINFLIGLFVPYIILYLIFRFNFLEMVKVLLSGLPKQRSYLVWIFYNLYDFFIFTGIPISTLYLYMIIKKIRDQLFWAFTFMLILINLSGAVRGEVGRIWLPFMSIMTPFVTFFLTKKLRLEKKFFIGIVLLQIIQVLVMQEFWVMLW